MKQRMVALMTALALMLATAVPALALPPEDRDSPGDPQACETGKLSKEICEGYE